MRRDAPRRLSATLLVLLACLSTTAFAQVVGWPETSAWCESPPPICLIAPDGQGPSLAEQNGTVYVELLDGGGNPVVGYPPQDIWLANWDGGTFRVCQAGSIADAPTDVNGQTTISHALYGGGWSEDRVQAYIAGGPPTSTPPLPLHIVSPDIDGNLIVDLNDIGVFALDFYSPGRYAFRSDFKPDGVLDLSDIGILADHYGTACP